MSVTVRVRSIALAGALLVSCGGAASPAATAASSTASRTATATPVATVSAAGPWTFTLDAPSKATVRVREVLAQIRAPGDAVLTSTGLKGAFTLSADGTFGTTSKITADLTALRSDQSQRDSFIKDNTLETRRFPTATFVPRQSTGLTLPLPVSADIKFTPSGDMTIHGRTKTVSFADFGMTVPRVASVLSIEDDIRLEIALLATETA